MRRGAESDNKREDDDGFGEESGGPIEFGWSSSAACDTLTAGRRLILLTSLENFAIPPRMFLP